MPAQLHFAIRLAGPGSAQPTAEAWAGFWGRQAGVNKAQAEGERIYGYRGQEAGTLV